MFNTFYSLIICTFSIICKVNVTIWVRKLRLRTNPKEFLNYFKSLRRKSFYVYKNTWIYKPILKSPKV